MKSISAVINARLQSTRIPRKLLRSFAGESLLEIALAKLNRMDFFEKRYLAVAEEELKALVPRYENVELLPREEAAVKKGVNPQTVTFGHYLRVPTDYIMMFNPCLPFVKVETIRQAYETFQATPITNIDPQVSDPTQGEVFYKCIHAFHIINKEFFRTHGYSWTFTPHDPHCIEIPMDVAVDIDTELEFNFAEFFYKKRKRAGNEG